MGYVVIRRFRAGDGPATSRAIRDEAEAREKARAWADEGWDVELIATGRLQHTSTRVARPAPRNLPERT
jgi:hypothetical protein